MRQVFFLAPPRVVAAAQLTTRSGPVDSRDALGGSKAAADPRLPRQAGKLMGWREGVDGIYFSPPLLSRWGPMFAVDVVRSRECRR